MNDLSNVEAYVLVGGCVLAVDLLTVAHEASERTAIPLQSNLIAATAFMEPPKEWMYIDKDGTQVGPFEKDAIRRLWSKKSIDWTTKCWATGMSDWKRLRDIRELRWALSVRVPVLTPTQVLKLKLAIRLIGRNCRVCVVPLSSINAMIRSFEGKKYSWDDIPIFLPFFPFQ
jgi:DnaJ homolog subfamily C member 13